jgi:hypothetical protein
MPRKRKALPQRVDEAKRKLATWNLEDLRQPNHGVVVIDDEDEMDIVEVTPRQPPCTTRNFAKTIKQLKTLWKFWLTVTSISACATR